MLDLILIVGLILFMVAYRVFVDMEGMVKVEGNDGRAYLVRNLPDKQQAASTLVDLRKTLMDLLVFIETNGSSQDPDFVRFQKYIPVMKAKLPGVRIRETGSNSKHTSYSVNKGQELVFCIRSKRDNALHPTNELLYVAIHELAHIGCPEIGHTSLFYELNLFLLRKAVEFNIYQYQNYDTNPREYCGINLNHTILNRKQ
jgi:hypothetical protein